MADIGEGSERTFSPGNTPPLEWAFAILGCGIVLGVVGYLGYRGVQEDAGRPGVVVRELRSERDGSDYRVDVELENTGRETAQSLQIVAELSRGGETLESDEAIVDYLPAESTRQIGFYFRTDPESADLTIRPGGFNYP